MTRLTLNSAVRIPGEEAQDGRREISPIALLWPALLTDLTRASLGRKQVPKGWPKNFCLVEGDGNESSSTFTPQSPQREKQEKM